VAAKFAVELALVEVVVVTLVDVEVLVVVMLVVDVVVVVLVGEALVVMVVDVYRYMVNVVVVWNGTNPILAGASSNADTTEIAKKSMDSIADLFNLTPPSPGLKQPRDAVAMPAA